MTFLTIYRQSLLSGRRLPLKSIITALKADENDVLSIQNNERMTSYVTVRITRFSPNSDQPPNSSHFSVF